MGWSQYTRRLEAQRRRSARDEARWVKETEKQFRALAKAKSQDAAARQVAEYESYVEQLVSLHTECGDIWDWRAVATSRAPEAPQRKPTHEQQAREAKEAYRPGLFERMTGAAEKRLQELDAEILRSAAADEGAFQHALEAHEAARRDWQELKAVASGMVAGDSASFRDALTRTRAFDAIENFDISVRLDIVDATLIVVWCDVDDSETVPTDENKLTASGKLSSKPLPPSRYWALFQDHVCSCALRIAREVFAVLPIRSAIVNVSLARMNSATGHPVRDPILSVRFDRPTLLGLNFASLDPSDAMKNFPTRMKFKKSTGFESVEPITPDDSWVTT